MKGSLIVGEVERRTDAIAAEVQVGGRTHELSFSAPGQRLAEGSDPLAACLLAVAMSQGLDLELPEAPSRALRANLPRAQALYSEWWGWPAVEVRARRDGETANGAGGEQVACFFSGGVDSFYSVMEERERLDAVIFVHGFDVALDDRERREAAVASVRAAASEAGIELVEVATDLRRVTNPYVDWGCTRTAPASRPWRCSWAIASGRC